MVAALLVFAACSRAPSSPSTPPASPAPAPVAFADFSGHWSGKAAYKACLGLHCSGTQDRADPFSFRFRQSGNHVTGVFVLNESNIEIAGDVQPDGSLQLTGAEATGGTTGVRGDATFAASALRLDPALGLKGSIRFERRQFLTSAGDNYTFVADASIVSAARQPLDAYLADLSGVWKGFYLVRQCTDEAGRPFCGLFRQGEVEYLALTVAVAGDSVAGELVPISTHIPVGGRVHGRTIDLQGARDETDGRLIDRVTAFSGTVDEFGRLKGTFAYVRTFNGVVSTAQVDLLEMVNVR
jgi:hypothetical protein